MNFEISLAVFIPNTPRNCAIPVLIILQELWQARRKGGGGPRGLNEPPLDDNNGGLKAQTVDFRLLPNGGGLENKLRVLQLLNYPARTR